VCTVEGRTEALSGVCSGGKNWSTVGCVQWKEELKHCRVCALEGRTGALLGVYSGRKN
jgi:hypothetical protein